MVDSKRLMRLAEKISEDQMTNDYLASDDVGVVGMLRESATELDSLRLEIDRLKKELAAYGGWSPPQLTLLDPDAKLLADHAAQVAAEARAEALPKCSDPARLAEIKEHFPSITSGNLRWVFAELDRAYGVATGPGKGADDGNS